ncbi:MATE family efflux transporter [Clostridium sardiniense]|uniref:MATE family efflux transporter n=1 Tax=Clostridium sardiniense TaxID=29369 RepID=UPI001956307F|nr:MATE family efflux transporter [Clostridium sardiniense]MBM7836366.1 putative MATE family efflux protein [Clostridium sardiniense]
MEENILGKEKISKLFIQFSIPAIIAMVIAGMQSMVDGVFIGNFVGSTAMASVSLGGPYIQLVIGLSMMISVGSLSFMGRSLGEGNKKLTQNIFRTALILLGVFAAVLTIIGVLFSDNIANLLGANPELLGGVSTYIRTISICIIPMSLAFLIGFADRLVEKPELYFKGMVLSLIVNITLNYILIKQMNLGIIGAALATGLSYTSVFIVVISPMLKKDNIINIFLGRFDKTTIIPMIYNGSSEAMTAVSSAISAYLFNMAFMSFTGEVGVAAFTSINYIAQFGTLIVFGIADGIGSIISYNYGAKYFGRVKSILKISLKIAFVVGIGTFLTLLFFGENIINLFVSSDQNVVNLAVQGSKIYAFAFLLNGFNTLCSSYFTSIGYAKESVIIALSRGLVCIALGITILPRIFGLNGVWLTIPFAELITIIICYCLASKYISSKKGTCSQAILD